MLDDKDLPLELMVGSESFCPNFGPLRNKDLSFKKPRCMNSNVISSLQSSSDHKPNTTTLPLTRDTILGENISVMWVDSA